MADAVMRCPLTTTALRDCNEAGKPTFGSVSVAALPLPSVKVPPLAARELVDT